MSEFDWSAEAQTLVRRRSAPTETEFIAAFGVSIRVIAEIYRKFSNRHPRLVQTIGTPFNVLMSFFFMKNYPTLALMSFLFEIPESTETTIIWPILEALHSSLPQVSLVIIKRSRQYLPCF